MEDKSVKVNCSFCGKEIECPENMLNAEKHACYECFEKIMEKKGGEKMTEEEIERIHVDIPRDKADEIADNYMINSVVDEAFPRFWKDKKDSLKDMPRRDAVYYAFGSGATAMLGLVKQI
ncbi:MAG: hypothetical protein AABX14_02695, partial [Candidatus Aenigmatarchaeota archaeon]